LLDLLDTPVDELLGDDWDHRPPHPTLIGVDGNDETVWIDILRHGTGNRLGLIFGPRADRDALLRTIVLSLALTYSPSTVTFSFVDFSGGASFVGLGSLPHVATAVHTTSTDSSLMSQLPWVLETERRRRETILQAAEVATWDDYQAAIANGRSLDPLPALIVILDNAEPLFEARHDMLEPIVSLCEAGPAQGILFILSSPEASPLSPRLAQLTGWRADFPAAEDGVNFASLRTEQKTHFSLRTARISLDVSDPIVERMRQRGPRASRLPWRTEPPTSPAPTHMAPRPDIAPETDVLRLNGGPNGRFEESWDRPASEPREPAIGYDADGNAVSLHPLDLSSGLPHGLVVGETAARQRVVRAIALALAATSSPSEVIIAFAGLGEHPLGDPIALPHVVYSEDELLGRPEKLQEFLRFLTDELDARAAEGAPESMVEELLSPDAPRPPVSPPRLLVVADISLTFPSSRREVGEGLLALAQRGKALGVQLLLSSTSVENTTMWDRFRPLLEWRIAASLLPPAELQRVLGQANLPFADERTAYLLVGGEAPRPFMVAAEPSASALDDFLERARTRLELQLRNDGLAELRARLSDTMAEYEERPEPVVHTRIPIGVEADTGEPVLVDFTAGRHLLISGPPGSGRTRLLQYLHREIETHTDALINTLEGNDRISWEPEETDSGGGDDSRAVEIGRHLREAVQGLNRHGAAGWGREFYLFVRNRRWSPKDDPLSRLLPLLGPRFGAGLHLVVSRSQTSEGEPADPLVQALRLADASVLLTGSTDCWEADLWGLPSDLRGPLPQGYGVLARSGRWRSVRLQMPT
ncbi:hypothetical protein E1264_29625, partial [Actinomadura sp. KC216]|uniref:FtsK/SpoIIIE domain-containing protein n=1 Tax=Actinomadura sp. KC216 TaxID=2530370 RepID=UPI0010436E8B